MIFLNKGEKYYVKSKMGCSYFTTAYDFSAESERTLSILPQVCECNALQIKIVEEITDKW